MTHDEPTEHPTRNTATRRNDERRQQALDHIAAIRQQLKDRRR